VSKRLEYALAQASQLSEEEQEALAAWIIEELEDERRWESAFAESEDVLATLANEALEEYRRGQTQELDPEEL